MAERGGVVAEGWEGLVSVLSGVVERTVDSAALESLSVEAWFGGEGGFGFCDDAWRVRVMEFNPTATKDEISGVGGIGSSEELSFPRCFASWRLRFLLLFPFDLVIWFARCCPIGVSSLQNTTT
jgi:hypothetical protein